MVCHGETQNGNKIRRTEECHQKQPSPFLYIRSLMSQKNIEHKVQSLEPRYLNFNSRTAILGRLLNSSLAHFLSVKKIIFT